MSIARIRGMRDLEVKEVRRLPERIDAAQRHGAVSDETLCELMGWALSDLTALKAGERVPSPAEMRALYGVFGKSSRGTLQTRWPNGGKPPLRKADWVMLGASLGKQSQITEADREADRLRTQVRQLRERVRELEAKVESYQQLEGALYEMSRRLSRRRAS
jgi:hypothetical protein